MVFKSLTLAGHRTSWSGTTITYVGIAHNGWDATSEAPVQIRAKGTNQVFSHLSIYVNFNSADAAIVFTFRKNGADGNQQLSIPAGTTGHFEDTVNTDTVATGDNLSTEGDASAVSSSGLGVVTSMIVYTVEDDDRAVSYFQMSDTDAAGIGLVDGNTGYIPIGGNRSAWSADPTNEYVKVNDDYVWDNLRIYIPTNENSKNTQTFYSYISGIGRGNQAISVPGTTGRFEDITNSDTLSRNDSVCIEGNNPATGGTRRIYLFSASSRFNFNGSSFMLLSYDFNSFAAGAADAYWGIGGGYHDQATRTEVLAPIRDFNVMFDRAIVYLSADDQTDGTTFTLLEAGVATSITFNVKTTGFTEFVGSHTFNPDTEASWLIELGTVETQTIWYTSLRGREVAPGTPYDSSTRLIGTIIASYDVQVRNIGTIIAPFSALVRLIGSVIIPYSSQVRNIGIIYRSYSTQVRLIGSIYRLYSTQVRIIGSSYRLYSSSVRLIGSSYRLYSSSVRNIGILTLVVKAKCHAALSVIRRRIF